MKPSIYTLMIAVLTSCTAQYVPLDYDTTLNNNQTFIEVDGVAYTMEFVSSNDDLVTFWLHIDNQSEDTVYLGDKATMAYSSPDFEAENTNIVAEGALGPDDVEFFYREKVRNANTMAVAAVIFGAALIVADAAADNRDSKKEYWSKKDERRYQSRNALTDFGVFTADMLVSSAGEQKYTAKEELRYLPGELFRKKSISPGFSHDGKLVFKNNVLYKYYRVKLLANGYTLNFDFRKAKSEEKQVLRGY